MALRTNLVNLWELEEASGTRVDSMAQCDLSTVTGSPANDTGVVGSAITLDGSSSVSRASVAHAFAGADAINLSAWVYPTTIGTGQQAIACFSNAGSAVSMSWRFNNTTGTMTFSLVDTNGTTRTVTKTAPSNDTWTHYFIRFVRNDSLYAYKNLDTASTGTVGNFAYSTNVTTPNTVVGARASTDRFIGKIDQLAVWTRDLSTIERTLVYNAGAGRNLLSPDSISKVHSTPLASLVHGVLS
jgi:hypothetical protein